ncbi:hypothetical protein M2150_001665 [Lachnospiraceae bacterium PM6-15]|uniref:hypothetical protein n=1 Tax=Ohessyouella blattaphilus TaxID=2949333 RepID=UPI003E28EF30
MEKLLELLTGKGLVEFGVSVWNGCAELVGIVLGQSPQGMQNEAWNFATQTIYPIFLTLGVALMCLFFVIGYARECVDIRQQLTLENSIKMFVRLVLSNALVTGALIWIPRFISWATGITSEVRRAGGGLGTLDANAVWDDTGLLELLNPIGTFVVSLFFMLVCMVCGFMILVPVYKRVFNLIIIIPFAPVALASFAGGQGLSHTGASWCKEFLAVCFEIVVMAIVLAIGGSFVNSGVFGVLTTFKFPAHLLSMLQATFGMITITTIFKGSNALIKRALGL